MSTMSTLSGVGARVLHERLDHDLEDYVPPASSSLHAARSVQLITPRHRRDVAAALECLLDRGLRPDALSSTPRPCPGQVATAEVALRDAARRLRSPEPVSACGVARLSHLVADRRGPAFRGRWDGELRDMVAEAVDALGRA